MRFRIPGLIICVVVLSLALAGTATAQNTSELTGRVIYQDEGMPGVTVTLTSPALQGQKVTATNAQGDYIVKGLPAGDYKVRFELATFTTLEFEVRMSTSQPRTVDAVIYPEAVEGEIVVTSSFETVSTGAQGSSTMQQSTLEKLPVLRTLESAVLLSAGTTNTGAGGITISGAQSWESLFTINGVVVSENIRGQPRDLYIEDAILETTTITSSASAEYGRFAGGVVNTVTKSGGNEFSGSFRANVTNESWNGKTPLTAAQADENNFVYEATFGGYIVRDALWFFGAARDRSTEGSGQLLVPGQPEAGVPYPSSSAETRLEGKLTGSIGPNHRIMLSYLDIDDTYTNGTNWGIPVGDMDSLISGGVPETGLSVTYTGVLSDNFFLEGLYSKRDMTFVGGGGTKTELGGSPIWDSLESLTWNDAWFDAAGNPVQRDNENYYAKASWFVSGGGTHDLVFGVDYFDNQNTEDNRQMASGYSYWPWVEQNYDTPGHPLVVIEPYGGYIVWGDLLMESIGSHMETTSLYVNDTWRVNKKLTVNLGLRYDKNDATDQAGLKTVDDYRVSPRLSASYDLKGDGSIILTAGANRYVMSTATNQGSAGSAAGDPMYNWYMYAGPEIIAGTEEYPTNSDALDAMFDWFFNVYGGPNNLELAYNIAIPGVVPRVGEGLRSPYGDELTVGASFRLGTRGVLRADYVHRKYGSFYAAETTPNNWIEVPNSGGAIVDDQVVINDDSVYSRKYDAIMARFDYRAGSRWNIGGNYTWAESAGNFNGETWDSGPVSGGFFQYQEYKEASWNVPNGLLDIDQTHKFRAWVVWDAIATSHNNLSLSLLQSFFSGTPYSAAAGIETVSYVGDYEDLGYANNPGYQTYFYTERGAFRRENVTRTDISLNYSFFINIGGGQLELFLQPEVINVFNEQAILTPNIFTLNSNNVDDLVPFNPFTETPVEGTNWRKGDSWGEAQSDSDYQQPRTFRFSVGLRF